MSAIKDFLKKKKMEAKFKIAGGGHKLGETPSSASTSRSSSNQQQAAGPPVAPSHQQTRHHPSSSAQQAGAAALNRIADQRQGGSGQNSTEQFKKNRQKALIKEQARKELEKEQQMIGEVEKINRIYGDHQPQEIEAPQRLAAQGVFFKCDLVGPEVLPKEEMKLKIKQFLYDQLEQERGLTAVLIIHTCNSPRDRVTTAVETLCKYLQNILDNPTEEKFRKIRRSNRAFSDRVANIEGTSEFLLDCGFQVKSLNGPNGTDEEFWVLEESADLDHLSMLQDSLKSCEPLTAELDRGVVVIAPGTGPGKSIGALPSDFFTLTSDEIKKEHQDKQDVVEREQMLRTKAMRDKEASVGRRKYKYCLVRIRFPDGYILQGTFSVYEQLSAVIQFVTDNLEFPLPFKLIDSTTGARINQEQATLMETGLVPASLFNFSWEDDMQDATTTFLATSLIH